MRTICSEPPAPGSAPPVQAQPGGRDLVLQVPTLSPPSVPPPGSPGAPSPLHGVTVATPRALPWARVTGRDGDSVGTAWGQQGAADAGASEMLLLCLSVRGRGERLCLQKRGGGRAFGTFLTRQEQSNPTGAGARARRTPRQSLEMFLGHISSLPRLGMGIKGSKQHPQHPSAAGPPRTGEQGSPKCRRGFGR